MAFGLGLIIAALGLVYLGMPDSDGNSPRFLRSGAARATYPAIILALFGFGAAEFVFSAMH
ncbi:hypothetical protein [Bradyrhizobium sp. USDA 10063]